MKSSITLSDVQDSRLTEMLMKLFPDQYFVCLDVPYNTILIYEKGKHKELSTYIHWFEFCLTHLVEKILNPNPDKPSRGLSDRFKEFYWEINMFWSDPTKGKHPVDWLYDKFRETNEYREY